MKSLLIKSGILLMSALLAIGCGSGKKDPAGKENKKTVITDKGSDTMVLLAQRWAEEYHALHPDVDIQVNGGGSGNGIAALIDGTTNIANASRTMKDEEKAKAKAKYGGDVVEIPVARDGIAIYLHPTNKVEQLTLDQLAGIYTGKITNWKEVGGADGTIIIYGRESSSGTYEFFKEHVLHKADFAPSTQTLSGTAAIVGAVTKDPKGIGYGGAAYTQGGIKQAKLVDAKGVAVAPTKENVMSGDYPLSRYLFFYLGQKPTGAIDDYIKWVLSPDGQKFVSEMEYFPLQ
jgi:phosphate transport system substrate-binding protein